MSLLSEPAGPALASLLASGGNMCQKGKGRGTTGMITRPA